MTNGDIVRGSQSQEVVAGPLKPEDLTPQLVPTPHLNQERHPGMLPVVDCMNLAGLSVSGMPWSLPR